MTDNDSNTKQKFLLGVGATGHTLDHLDQLVQDARNAGIPGDSLVCSGKTAKGFALTIGQDPLRDEPTPTPPGGSAVPSRLNRPGC
jgi:hypothetical protein